MTEFIQYPVNGYVDGTVDLKRRGFAPEGIVYRDDTLFVAQSRDCYDYNPSLAGPFDSKGKKTEKLEVEAELKATRERCSACSMKVECMPVTCVYRVPHPYNGVRYAVTTSGRMLKDSGCGITGGTTSTKGLYEFKISVRNQ